MLLSEAFKKYAQDVIIFRNQSASTEEQHYLVLRSLIAYLGDIPVNTLDFPQVRDWKISLDKRNLSDLTVRLYLTRLRAVLSYLNLRGIKTLQAEEIKLPRRSQKVPAVLTEQEVQRLIDATSLLRNKVIISLLYSTGLRVSELCDLDRDTVKDDCFNLIGKGGKDRLCFIDKRTRDLLTLYLSQRSDGHDVYVKNHGVWTNKVRYHVNGDNLAPLFINRQTKQRLNPGAIQFIVRGAAHRAAIKWGVHPHTIRHSYASNMMINGINLYQLMKLMGHSSLQTTQIYLHISDKHLAEDYQRYHTV